VLIKIVNLDFDFFGLAHLRDYVMRIPQRVRVCGLGRGDVVYFKGNTVYYTLINDAGHTCVDIDVPEVGSIEFYAGSRAYLQHKGLITYDDIARCGEPTYDYEEVQTVGVVRPVREVSEELKPNCEDCVQVVPGFTHLWVPQPITIRRITRIYYRKWNGSTCTSLNVVPQDTYHVDIIFNAPSIFSWGEYEEEAFSNYYYIYAVPRADELLRLCVLRRGSETCFSTPIYNGTITYYIAGGFLEDLGYRGYY